MYLHYHGKYMVIVLQSFSKETYGHFGEHILEKGDT